MPGGNPRLRLGIHSAPLLVGFLTLIAALLGSMNGLGRFDQAFYDRAVIAAARPASDDILLVTIDTQTVEALGRGPWSRAVHAALLGRLQEARAVGLDFRLSEHDNIDPNGDVALAEALRSHGRVVLPASLTPLPRPTSLEQPLSQLAGAAAGVGFVNVPTDTDGVIRQAVWRTSLREQRWQHLALAMLEIGGETELARTLGRRLGSSGEGGIPYSGPPGHLRSVSYLQVLQGRVPAAWIQDKYVLVGRAAATGGDTYRTPGSAPAGGMSSVELVGNMMQAARQDLVIQPAAPWLNALACALPVLLLCLALRHLPPRGALLLTGVMLVAVLAGAFLMLRYLQLWFAPSAALLGLALSYPLWSWRGQEAVLRHMDSELKRLRQEYPPIMGEARLLALATSWSVEDRLDELRQALTRVRNLRRFLADSLDGIPDATLVFDAGGRLQFCNRAALDYFRGLGVRAPRNGQPAAWLMEKIVADATVRAEINRALHDVHPDEREAPWSLDQEVRDYTGRSFLVKCAPIRNDEDAFAGSVVTLSDITAIRAAERKREETLRFVSHDMRAPQNSILALVDLSRGLQQSEEGREAWSRVEQQAHRTLRLVDDFVHLTRAESLKIGETRVDLTALVLDAMDDVWALARARGIALEPQDMPQAFVRGDHALLRRALNNLLDNAIKYTPEGGHVSAALRADGAHWVVAVADDGVGIAPEDVPRLFQAFSRVGSTRSDTAGAGLGLAFVHTVATRHGGGVQVSSRHGTGSTFTLSLPADMADDEDDIARPR
ncbi:CHASE2 domain-containing protein [Bordetella genomosp. 13]|uniref:CHASE2 domain-containing protein n=1 Tax=Bordetella genomosp. 13 TaxID=463040 RepID=UPI0011A145D6|nr:CHASE2 domain-containing protein [Bordetella genomosp. 13]